MGLLIRFRVSVVGKLECLILKKIGVVSVVAIEFSLKCSFCGDERYLGRDLFLNTVAHVKRKTLLAYQLLYVESVMEIRRRWRPFKDISHTLINYFETNI